MTRSLRVLAVLLLTGAFPFTAQPAPDAVPWERWAPHDARSTLSVDHGAWDRLLKIYVSAGTDGVHRFDYAGVTPADRRALDDYLETLAATPVTRLTRDAQRAYWINLYNALTVQVVLAHYPVESIRDIDISPGLFASGPWGKKLIEVEGEAISLDDVEHRILRPIWRDPRIHYAVNCASLGCPDLLREAFTAQNAEELLDRGARRYVNHPRGVSARGDSLTVSSIYVWFRKDFGDSDAGVIAHLKRYATPELAARLAGITRITDDRYDWSINDLR